MSKKYNTKKKINLKLSPEDTAIVVSYDTAMHIAETYDYLANDVELEYANYYREVADLIRSQASENYYGIEEEYDEWE